MDDRITEQQQIELLKKIWKEYGVSVIVGVTLAIVLGFGWRYYQSYVIQRAQHASVIYESMMIDTMNNQQEAATKQANYLIKNYKRTPFADFASLLLAQQSVKQNNLDKAIKQLQWTISYTASSSIKQIARIRLSRVYLVKDNAKQALSELSNVKEKAYEGLVAEVQGDAYKQLKELDKARESYQKALTLLPEDAVNRPLIEMKLHDLPAED